MPTLFIDNGGNTLRAIYSRALGRETLLSSLGGGTTADDLVTLTAPNAIGITADGAQVCGNALLALPHYHQLVLRRPTEKGFIVDAQLQATLWSQCLFEPLGIVSERDLDLVLTCPVACPHDAAQAMEALLFELFKFRSVTLVTTSMLSMVGADVLSSPPSPTAAACAGSSSPVGEKRQREVDDGAQPGSKAPLTGIVVDCGFSGTTITPFLGGRPISWNTTRIDVGGKLLTNHLKELISFSQVNLTEDTWLCNAIKERCCFVHGGCGGDTTEESSHAAAAATADTITVSATSTASPVAAHCAKHSGSLLAALALYQRWGELGPMEKRRAVAGQRRVIKAMLKQLKDKEKEERKRIKSSSKKSGAASIAAGEEKDAAAASSVNKEATATAMAEAASRFWFPPPAVAYVLPSTPQTQPLGYVVSAAEQQEQQQNDDWQYVRLGHECFIVGEALFHPRLLGLQQVGIAEAVRHGLWYDPRRAGTPLFGAPRALQQALMGNIIVTGGTGVGMDGFAGRLEAELRPSLVGQSDAAETANKQSFVSLCSDQFVLPNLATTNKSTRRRIEIDDGTAPLVKSTAMTAVIPSPSSFLMIGALALFFGQHQAAMRHLVGSIGGGGVSEKINTDSATVASMVEAFLDAQCTILAAKLTRDSVRAALGLIR